MTTALPVPPMLVLREGIAFWVETRAVQAWSATRQALESGCFAHTCCYDTAGKLWPIVDARVERPLLWRERLLPWRPVPVVVAFGQPTVASVTAVAERLIDTLDFEGDEFDPSTQEQIRQKARSARTPNELIEAMAPYSDT
jgi:hypothetical protein